MQIDTFTARISRNICCCCCSVTQFCLTLWPHGLRHVRPPCSLPSSGVCPSSCPLHQWCHPANSSCDPLFFYPLSFPASRTFPVSRLFTSDDQSTGASASASVLPVNIQGWSPVRLTDLIFLLFKGLSGVFSSTTVRRYRFFGILPSLQSSSQPYMTTETMIALTTDLCHQSNVSAYQQTV